MGIATKIQWTDHTFNPWRGCVKVSPGCANCYAEKQSHRNPGVLGEWGPNSRRVIGSDAYWRQPLAWDAAAAEANERRRVFCASLGDVFEGRRDLDESRARLFALIDRTPNLDWLLLTKRPENIEQMWHTRVEFDGDGRQWGESKPTRRVFCRHNVWLGTSVEDQVRLDERSRHLERCRDLAPVLFYSLEPLLGPLDFRWPPLVAPIDWVIVGGESGPNARACSVKWIRSIRDQCRSASVPVFIKQLGSRPYYEAFNPNAPAFDDYQIFVKFRDKKGGDPAEWPEDLRVREFPIGVPA